MFGLLPTVDPYIGSAAISCAVNSISTTPPGPSLSSIDLSFDIAVAILALTISGTVAKELLEQINKAEKLKSFDGTALLTKERATELREALKGAYVTDILGPASKLRVGEAQFGTPKISKKKFDDLIVKEGKLAKTILGDQDFKRLKNLNTQIAFSQGNPANPAAPAKPTLSLIHI